jgi:hypothetical protein
MFHLGRLPVVVGSYEYAVCFDAPVCTHSDVVHETALALFYTLRELDPAVGLFVECVEVEESLSVLNVGKYWLHCTELRKAKTSAEPRWICSSPREVVCGDGKVVPRKDTVEQLCFLE